MFDYILDNWLWFFGIAALVGIGSLGVGFRFSRQSRSSKKFYDVSGSSQHYDS